MCLIWVKGYDLENLRALKWWASVSEIKRVGANRLMDGGSGNKVRVFLLILILPPKITHDIPLAGSFPNGRAQCAVLMKPLLSVSQQRPSGKAQLLS